MLGFLYGKKEEEAVTTPLTSSHITRDSVKSVIADMSREELAALDAAIRKHEPPAPPPPPTIDFAKLAALASSPDLTLAAVDVLRREIDNSAKKYIHEDKEKERAAEALAEAEAIAAKLASPEFAVLKQRALALDKRSAEFFATQHLTPVVLPLVLKGSADYVNDQVANILFNGDRPDPHEVDSTFSFNAFGLQIHKDSPAYNADVAAAFEDALDNLNSSDLPIEVLKLSPAYKQAESLTAELVKLWDDIDNYATANNIDKDCLIDFAEVDKLKQ